MDLGISGNTAVTVASSSGLGKASAKALAREGANVVINGRDADRVEAAVDELSGVADGEVIGCPGDLADPELPGAVVETAVEAFGGIDHVVTSAGGPPTGPALEFDDAAWQEAYDMMVMGPVRLVREAAPQLRSDGGGSIVHITSITVKESFESFVLSNSVRMALAGFAKTLSRELAPEVRANVVLPGLHRTERFQEGVDRDFAAGDYASREAVIADRASVVPLARIADPDEFGDVVAFLSSARASYVTGIAMLVDGGWSRSNL